MARLQDFNSVTPATSDNLLIVQSQGQGLSTLNAVGQKVATETTMSSLTTTSKNLVGAVNEVNSKKASDIEYSSGVTIKQKIDTKQDTLTLTDGTVTWNTTNVDGDVSKKVWYQYGRIVIAHLEFTPLSGKIANGNVICSGLPVPTVPYYTAFNGNSQQLTINSNGNLVYWYPTDTTTLRRTDITLVYTK